MSSIHCVELGESCFSHCRCLRSLTFGPSPSLELIGYLCFDGSALTSVELPPSLVKVVGGVFNNCSLACENFFCENCSFVAVGCVLLSEAGRFCHGTFSQVSEVVIPDSVVELCPRSFLLCKSLRSVKFSASSNLERIGAWAFEAAGLEFLSLPDSVVELGMCCFVRCDRLCSVTFSSLSNLEVIGDGAFHWSGLESFSIPDSVVEVGNMCFYGSESLGSVTFGSSSRLKRICHAAFSRTRIESLCLPSSVVELSSGCFSDCRSLRSVTFAATPSNLERIGAYAFSETILESVCLPESVVVEL